MRAFLLPSTDFDNLLSIRQAGVTIADHFCHPVGRGPATLASLVRSLHADVVGPLDLVLADALLCGRLFRVGADRRQRPLADRRKR
jgi:hypothetical protein